MSTVKAINFQHPNSSNINMVLDQYGAVSGGLPSPNRNLLYNGAMQVAQRGTSSAGVVASGYLTADRWATGISSLGTWTQTIENDAPTGSGFRKSLKMLCTTAKASPAASDFARISQILEGQDVQRIAKGTTSAQPLTLSFWVKSNLTGTFCVFIYDADNARSSSVAYTINASATWEKKSVTFSADTTGAFDNDNANSLELYFGLAGGSNYTSGTVNASWAAWTPANSLAGQTNVAAAVNNYWQVTGVQLETGPAPTPFEFKPYAQELRECQRYYQKILDGYPIYFGWADVANRWLYQDSTLITSMRATPTVTVTGTMQGSSNAVGGGSIGPHAFFVQVKSSAAGSDIYCYPTTLIAESEL